MSGLDIVIDPGMCMGAGECVFAAPHVFQLGDDRKAVATNIDTATEATLLDAANACPNFAITILRDGARLS